MGGVEHVHIQPPLRRKHGLHRLTRHIGTELEAMPILARIQQLVRIRVRSHHTRPFPIAQSGHEVLLRRPVVYASSPRMEGHMLGPRPHRRILSRQHTRRLAVLDVLHLLAPTNHRSHHPVHVQHFACWCCCLVNDFSSCQQVEISIYWLEGALVVVIMPHMIIIISAPSSRTCHGPRANLAIFVPKNECQHPRAFPCVHVRSHAFTCVPMCPRLFPTGIGF